MNSEKRLMQAIKCLLDKHPIEKITINMILEESDLSKSTFYKYYSDKYDLAVSYYNYVIKTKIEDSSLSFSDNVERLLNFIKGNPNYYYHLIKIDEQENFFNVFYNSSMDNSYKIIETEKKEPLSNTEKISLSLFVAGCGYIVQKWITNGMKEEPCELAQIMYESIPIALKKYF